MIAIGVDLGGTNLRAAVVDTSTGKVLTNAHRPTQADEGPEAVTERMASLIDEACRSSDHSMNQIGAIGIGIPGLYDPDTNKVRFLPNLPTAWHGVPLGPDIESHTGRPTTLLNDARAFVLGEATFGAGIGADTVVGMALGTGIGGGVVVNGHLHMGIDGTAGEVGHQIIDFNGPDCGCGSKGCLETFASGPAISTMAFKAVRQGWTTAIRDLIDGDLNRITPGIVVEAAEAGDPIAQRILNEVGLYLGIGVANLVTLFSPNVVVIGGGVAQARDWLFDPIQETVEARCHATPVDAVQIKHAELGQNGSTTGAALWSVRQRQSHHDETPSSKKGVSNR